MKLPKRKRCPKCGGWLELTHVTHPDKQEIDYWQYCHDWAPFLFGIRKGKLCDYVEEVEEK